MKANVKAFHSDQAKSDLVDWEAPPSASPVSEKRSVPAKTLLVVDDDPLVRDLQSQVLRLEGYTVLEAENATEAMRLAASVAAIHLLITDLSMPEVDGLELTRRFRTVHPKTPVLMV